jgi:hypothetical protein
MYCLPPAGGRIRSKVIIACLRQVVAFAPKVIKCAVGAIKGNYCLPPAGGRIRSQGNSCGSGLFLLHNKGKNYAVFCFAGKRKFIYLYL